MMTKIKVRVVDAYIYFLKADGQLDYLLLKRSKTRQYEHLWQGVAGKIEQGETAPEAIIRELFEETGLTPKRLFVADHVSHFYEAYQDQMNLVPVFGIEVNSQVVHISKEHSEYQWVSVEKAEKTLIWKGQKQGLITVNEMVLSRDDRIRWTDINTRKI